MIFKLERTKPGTRTLIAKGRAVTLTHGEPLMVFLNAEQSMAFSNTAGVTVKEVKKLKPTPDPAMKKSIDNLIADHSDAAGQGVKKGRK